MFKYRIFCVAVITLFSVVVASHRDNEFDGGITQNQEEDGSISTDVDVNELREAIKEFHVGQTVDSNLALSPCSLNIFCITRLLTGNTIYTNIDKSRIQRIFNSIDTKLQEFKDQWVIIIFAENVWGNDSAILCTDQVNNIVQKCQTLTASYPKLIVHINFLHKFNLDDEPLPEWLKNYVLPRNLNERTVTNRLVHAEEAQKRYFKYIISLSQHGTIFKNRFANYSLIIFQQQPIAIYRKSAYCHELDSSIARLGVTQLNQNTALFYEFGDFQSKMLNCGSKTACDVAKIFAGDDALIDTAICADLNFSLIPSDIDHQVKQKEMLIVPANSFLREYPINYKSFVCVDANNGVFGKSGNSVFSPQLESIGDNQPTQNSQNPLDHSFDDVTTGNESSSSHVLAENQTLAVSPIFDKPTSTQVVTGHNNPLNNDSFYICCINKTTQNLIVQPMDGNATSFIVYDPDRHIFDGNGCCSCGSCLID